MFDDLTWDAILQAWPWFGAAAAVFVVAVGSFIALKPKPKRQPETAADAADNMEWTLTRRIDLADPQSIGRLCSKWRSVEFPRAQLASSTAKFVGEGQRYLRQRWFWSLTMPNRRRDVGDFHGHCSRWDEASKRASREHRDRIERCG